MTIRNAQSADYSLDAHAVRRSFEAASATYDQAAILQTEIRNRVLERLDLVRLVPEVVLDLGAGTGHATQALRRRYPRARVIAMDVSLGMLEQARARFSWWRRFDRLCADGARLPLADRSVDLVFSNLMLQWCDPPDLVFAEVRRVLKPGGLFTFTTFGPDTLKELRAAWAQVDHHTHVNRFIDMHDLGDALVRSGLAEPVLDVEHFTITHENVRQLMHDLKAIGAHNVTRGRRAGLTGRSALRTMSEAYEQFRRDGKLPATYEVVYGQAWGAVERSRPQSGAEIKVPLSALRRRE